MTLRLIRHRAGGATCVHCPLIASRARRFVTDRAVFQHLLWHRDCGETVTECDLDEWDRDGQDESVISMPKFSQGFEHLHGERALGTYGLAPDGTMVYAGACGRPPRGRIRTAGRAAMFRDGGSTSESGPS